jgi:hypothetical protein
MDDAGCSVAALTERAAKAALPIAADAPRDVDHLAASLH